MKRKNSKTLMAGITVLLLILLVCAQQNTQAISLIDLGPYETYPNQGVFFSFTARTHAIWGNRDNVFVKLMITPHSSITNLSVNVENVTFIVSTYKDFSQNISRKYYYFPIYRSNFTEIVGKVHNISFTFNVPRDVTTDMMIGIRIFFNYTYNYENITGVSGIKDVGYVKYKEYFYNILGFDFLTIVLGTLLLAYPIAYFSIKRNTRIKIFALLSLVTITGLVVLPVSRVYISSALQMPIKYKSIQYNISDKTLNTTINFNVSAPERVVYPNVIPIHIELVITKGNSKYNITGISFIFKGYFSSNNTLINQQDTNTISAFVTNSTNTTREEVVKIYTTKEVNLIPGNIKLIGFTANNTIYERVINETTGVPVDIIHWWEDSSQYARLYSSIIFVGIILIGNGFIIIRWLKGKKSKEEYYL